MASAIIHLCVAKKINDYLKMDERYFSIGAIAPDIAKIVGETKNRSHFMDEGVSESNLPHFEKFILKYKDDLDKPFEMGYLVHLLTDFYWFKDFIPKMISDYTSENNITYTALKDIIYNDYTSLNQDLIDKYMLDLYYFQNEMELPKSKIEEIPMDKLDRLIEKMGLLILNMNQQKLVMMDDTEILFFIETCANNIIDDLNRMNLIGESYEKSK